jgi:Reverse transcriptase (RNA-dependent DNA polymerase)
VTTQLAKQIIRENGMRQHFKTRFPALNVPRRSEAVATDTVFSDTKAIDDGSLCAQIFISHKSLVADIYGMKTDKEFVNTLEDQIRLRGAMDRLLSDRAQSEISKRVKDILRAYAIGEWQSEPNNQHQNPAETRYRTIKEYTNNILNRTGAPPSTWLLCMTYVCHLLNHLACASLDYKIPLTVMDGHTRDISVFQHYYFFQPVYYRFYDSSFPSDNQERSGKWVGIAPNVGDALTYKILSDTTKKIIYTSVIRPGDNPLSENKRCSITTRGEIDKKPIVFVRDRFDDVSSGLSHRHTPLPMFDPDAMLGRTFLHTMDNGEQLQAKVSRKIMEDDGDPTTDNIKYLLSIDDNQADEIVSYNEIVEWINNQDNTPLMGPEPFYKFRSIIGHQGPISSNHKDYKGSPYNLLIEWENGESTYEPLESIAQDDPVTCAAYAKKNNLLGTYGWKRFKRIADQGDTLVRVANQAIRQSRRAMISKFGYRVPRNHNEAVEIDALNGDRKWQDAEKLELSRIDEYNTFINKGKAQFDRDRKITNAPEGYKKIRVHMVYDVKHDGRHKARLVADGHLTDIPIESAYSGVVSLRSLRLVMFLAELNKLELWGADIGNAYLEAETREKVFIVAGPEFGERQGCMLIIHKALYGLRLKWKHGEKDLQKL